VGFVVDMVGRRSRRWWIRPLALCNLNHRARGAEPDTGDGAGTVQPSDRWPGRP
jgi:glutamate synthase domain-containing protein 1